MLDSSFSVPPSHGYTSLPNWNLDLTKYKVPWQTRGFCIIKLKPHDCNKQPSWGPPGTRVAAFHLLLFGLRGQEGLKRLSSVAVEPSAKVQLVLTGWVDGPKKLSNFIFTPKMVQPQKA